MSFIDNLMSGFRRGKQAQAPQVQTAGNNTQPITQAQLDAFKSAIKPADYTTQLDPNEQAAFNKWVSDMRSKGAINPNDQFQDYDMQGYWKNEVLNNTNLANGNAQAHFTDKYKMPNHPTFSNESMYYNNANSPYAGSWQGESFISPVVNPQQPQQSNEQKQNAVIRAIQGIAPTNWSDNTRQKVLLASKFLTGFGGTPYNPNTDLMGNIAQGVSNGSNEAYKQMENFNNYQNTRALYNQMGLDTSALNPVGDYSSMTPVQAISLGIRQQQNKIRNEIANTNDKTKRLTLILNNYNKGSISAEEAQNLMKLYGLDINDLQESNETKKTNSQIEVNDERKKLLNKQTENVGKPKVTINKRVGGTTSTVNINHTGGGGGSSSSKREKKLLY